MANKPITPEEMKAYVDATWEKCQAEAWQEPVAWMGLTIREIEWCFEDASGDNIVAARNIEAKLREKNT